MSAPKRSRLSPSGRDKEVNSVQDSPLWSILDTNQITDIFLVELLDNTSNQDKLIEAHSGPGNGEFNRSDFELAKVALPSAEARINEDIEDARRRLEGLLGVKKKSQDTKETLGHAELLYRAANRNDLDPPEYTEDIMEILVRNIDFKNPPPFPSIREALNLNSLNDFEKIKSTKVLIKLLKAAGGMDTGLVGRDDFKDHMKALKKEGFFWRESFPIEQVVCNIKLNLETAQNLAAIYFQATGYRDRFDKENKKIKFENKTRKGERPWTSEPPGRAPRPKPTPSLNSSPRNVSFSAPPEQARAPVVMDPGAYPISLAFTPVSKPFTVYIREVTPSSEACIPVSTPWAT